jgi:hypothetical protein
MMTCQDVVRNLPLLIYGEASTDLEESLHAHLADCPGCRSERLRLEHLLSVLDDTEADLPPGMLANCRRSLRINVAALSEEPKGIRRWFGEWLKPAAALALLLVGFGIGKLGPAKATPEPVETAAVLATPASARVRFIEPTQDGRVKLVLEETHERVLQGRAGDDNIRGLLLAAARESADPGLRVDSVDVLGAGPETEEVKKALLYALLHDANPGVRLKAIDGLRSSAADAETRKALARVLLTDENPGVRTQAIDLLVQKREPGVEGVLQEALRKDDNNYVRLKCQKALHELRASAESF